MKDMTHKFACLLYYAGVM